MAISNEAPTVHLLLKLTGLACLAALVILSLLPQKPQSGLQNGQLEHIIAYMGTAGLLGVTHRAPQTRVAVVGLLVTLAIVLEAAQILLPGREAKLLDVAAGAAGACIGMLIIAHADRLSRRRPL